MNTEKRSWYAVYTKPRWEKKVSKELEKKGIEVYCPLNKVLRKWSDRMKTIEEPLFKSYVFVRVDKKDITEVRYVDGVLNYVYWNCKPAVVKDEEIVAIRKFLSEYEDVEVTSYDIRPADRVMLNTGVMMGATGHILRVLSNNTVEVRIDSLGFLLTAKFEKKTIVKV
ncbi:MAG: UpxY family transcription antiterminator [Bacteroidetes bacterium]|nr:UpxY family transcription antiterminator [Bacteroidota bacterium]